MKDIFIPQEPGDTIAKATSIVIQPSHETDEAIQRICRRTRPPAFEVQVRLVIWVPRTTIPRKNPLACPAPIWEPIAPGDDLDGT